MGRVLFFVFCSKSFFFRTLKMCTLHLSSFLYHFNHYLSHFKHLNPTSHYLSNPHLKTHCDCSKSNDFHENVHLKQKPPINDHHDGEHPVDGHSMSTINHHQRPNFKLNDHRNEKHKSTDDKFDEKEDKLASDKTTMNKNDDFPKLPPDELMNQLVDFDLNYLSPKNDHPSFHSIVEDKYKRLLYGQFHENPINPINPMHHNSIPNSASVEKDEKIDRRQPMKNNKKSIKRNKKKDLDSFKLPNGGEIQFMKMGIIK